MNIQYFFMSFCDYHTLLTFGVARGLVPANLFEEYFQSHIRKKKAYT